MDTENLFDEETEIKQDRRAIESLNKLENYLNTKPNTDEGFRNLINQLEELKMEIDTSKYEVPETENDTSEYETAETENDMTNSQSQSESNEKVKVLTRRENKFNNTKPKIDNTEKEIDNTGKEIGESFAICTIYCTVTAIMGTLWFLYIINHI